VVQLEQRLKAAWLSITSPNRKEGKMSEDRTKDLNQPRSDDERFERMEIRITKLEDREYDTKPIWERALAEIAESRLESRTNIEGLRNEMKADIEGLRTEMKAEFAAVRHEIEHGLRGVARTIDTLNHNVLEMQTYQRYLDRQLEELETQIKTT
jgi:hypothetical protein